MFQLIWVILELGTMDSVRSTTTRTVPTVSIVRPYFTIFDLQVAYPDDVTLSEFREGILDSVESAISPLSGSIRDRFRVAVPYVNMDSPYTMFTLAGAIHFAQLAIFQPPESKDWILWNIVDELLDRIIKFPRTHLEVRLNKIFSAYSEYMHIAFGNRRNALIAFETMFVVVQLDNIPLTYRKAVFSKFLQFLKAAQEIMGERFSSEFDKAQRIILLKENVMGELSKSNSEILINPPLGVDESKSAPLSSGKWNIFKRNRIL